MGNEAKIGRVAVQTLMLHGKRDEVVPAAHGRRLFELAGRPVRFVPIDGAGHNHTYRVRREPCAQA